MSSNGDGMGSVAQDPLKETRDRYVREAAYFEWLRRCRYGDSSDSQQARDADWIRGEVFIQNYWPSLYRYQPIESAKVIQISTVAPRPKAMAAAAGGR